MCFIRSANNITMGWPKQPVSSWHFLNQPYGRVRWCKCKWNIGSYCYCRSFYTPLRRAGPRRDCAGGRFVFIWFKVCLFAVYTKPSSTFLDDDMVADDVVTKHLSFDALLTSMWSHHPCTLASSAGRILWKVRELMLSTGCFANEILRLPSPEVLVAGIIWDELIQLVFIRRFLTRSASARLRGRHCEQFLEMLVLLNAFLCEDFAWVIQNWDMTFNLELDDFSVRTNKNGFTTCRHTEL